MTISRRVIAALLLAALVSPPLAHAQAVDAADTWRAFVEKVEVGSELNVRLRNGQRFRATLVRSTPDALVLLPKTRMPVDVQKVSYSDVASLERRQHEGIGAGKAAAIGVASGAAGFLAALLILFAAISD